MAIIGAGFSGIVAALRLKASGRTSFVILERAAGVGGTWRDNTYPGCACDVPSNLYSISSIPNPNWSHAYSSQAEILAYLQRVVEEHELEPYIRFNSDVCRMEFLGADGVWRISDRAGASLLARSVILGMGPFARPKMPDLEGIDCFQGETLHSAKWDHSVSLENKRVGIIGTGASAAQIIPNIASRVAHLTVFQRSAAWVSSRLDGPVPRAKQEQYQSQPWRQRFERTLLYWFLELRGQMFLGNKWVHRYFKNLSLQKLEREVHDPELRRKLTPTYEFGCKRILSSDDYWPSFNRQNVTLETDPVVAITPSGICTTHSEHSFDVLIFATGFEVADARRDMQIVGRGGRELFSEWDRQGLQAYKGTSISGFPNLNFMLGPNSGLGHSSMITVMENQMNYITSYLDLLEKSGAAYLDLKPEIQQSYNRRIQELFTGTVWASGCKSWYLNARGKNTTLYPRLLESFRRTTAQVMAHEYEQVKG